MQADSTLHCKYFKTSEISDSNKWTKLPKIALESIKQHPSPSSVLAGRVHQSITISSMYDSKKNGYIKYDTDALKARGLYPLKYLKHVYSLQGRLD